MYSPPTTSLYVMGGSLSNYVPATMLANGSVTIRVMWTGGSAGFAIGSTLTFPVTTATWIVSDWNGKIRNGSIGQVRILTGSRISTLATLQAHTATSVAVNRAPEMNNFGRTAGP